MPSVRPVIPFGPRCRRSALVAACAVALGMAPGPAVAIEEGWYLGGFGGLNLHQEGLNLSGGGTGYQPEFAQGLALGIAGGFRKKALRLEGEIAFRHNELQTLKGISGNTLISQTEASPALGSISSVTAFTNAYLHLPVPYAFDPYVGLGIGVTHVIVDRLRAQGVDILDGSDTGAAVQVMVGSGLDFIPVPFQISIEYRFFYAERISITTNDQALKYENENHSFVLGVRKAF